MLIKEVKRVIIVVVFIFTSSIYSQNRKESLNLLKAYEAQGSLKLKDSKILFESVVNNDTETLEDRCKALRAIAIHDWKFYKNYETAKHRIKSADSLGHNKTLTWLALARIEVESYHYTKAHIAAKEAINTAISEADKTYAKYKYASIILQQAISQINKKIDYDNQLINRASIILTEVLDINPTNVNASETLLGLSLLRKDGDLALKSWLSYYRLSDSKNVYPYLKTSAQQLKDILPRLGDKNLTNLKNIELIKALAKSRFYNYAGLLAKQFIKNTSSKIEDYKDINAIIYYTNYLDDLKLFTNEYYRKRTIESNNVSLNYVGELRSKSETLYNHFLDMNLVKGDYTFNGFRDEIRSRFGTVMLIASTSSSNITGLVMGQIVNEEQREIEQYGHKADFTFTDLDFMVSNGYPSWFWEDRGTGGFAIQNGFIRVKKMFKHLGIEAWEAVTDSVKRSKREIKINSNLLNATKVIDKKNILSGLAKKLELDALDTLYNDLVAKGHKDVDLQLKFIERYDAYRDNATMFAHEGRHSLDRVVLKEEYRSLGTAKIEYRARLSQIVFSESPKLELANMINGIGTTGSGLANKLILDVAEEWIKINSINIKGFDKSKLPISQLYKLTDTQIKDCYRSVDPFYLNN